MSKTNFDLMLDMVERTYNRLYANWSRHLVVQIREIAKEEEQKHDMTVIDNILVAGIREANSRLSRVIRRRQILDTVEQHKPMPCAKCNRRCESTEIAVQGNNMFCLRCLNPAFEDCLVIRSGVVNELRELTKKMTGTHSVAAGYPETDYVCVMVFEELRAADILADQWPFDYATEKKIFSNSKLVMALSSEFYMDTYLQIKQQTDVVTAEYTKWNEAVNRIEFIRNMRR